MTSLTQKTFTQPNVMFLTNVIWSFWETCLIFAVLLDAANGADMTHVSFKWKLHGLYLCLQKASILNAIVLLFNVFSIAVLC